MEHSPCGIVSCRIVVEDHDRSAASASSRFANDQLSGIHQRKLDHPKEQYEHGYKREQELHVNGASLMFSAAESH
jgi:hypothetical protein